MEIKLNKKNIKYTTGGYIDYKYHIKNIENTWENILNEVHLFLPYNKKFSIVDKLNNLKNKKDGVVLKFSSYNNKNIIDDYNNGKKLEKLKGYIKYICYVENEYNFLNSLYINNKYDDELNNDTGIIIMPYYNYNMANYDWNSSNILDFINCLKQIVLSHYIAYYKLNIINVDLNVYNVLLNVLKLKKNIDYNYDDCNINYIIKKCKIEININDFQNSINIIDINNKENYIHLYYSLINIFTYYIENENDKYKNFININDIHDYLNNIIYNNSYENPMNILKYLLELIDKILYIEI